MPSWDGVPLDVDVTLPASGDGPFPTIVMLHGWGGSKTSFESAEPEGGGGTTYHYNNTYFAQHGYAVITPSSRGFGRSCGAMDSRTSPGCDQGWVRLADHRYEGRDIQYLLGLLVDQDVVNPDEIGVTGISYGGIQSLNLARLRNRIRLPGGSYKPWRSPKGTKLSIAAAYPRWGGSDMTYALQPNGRFLDFRDYHVGQSGSPGGVQKQSYVGGLYASGNGSGFYAPVTGPFNANLTLWKSLTDAGEPETPQVLRVGARADRLPQHRRAERRARAAARRERLDRRPLPRRGGAARVAHLPQGQGGARDAAVRRPGPPARREQGRRGQGAQHPGREVLQRLSQGRRAAPRVRARSRPSPRPVRPTLPQAGRTTRAAGRGSRPSRVAFRAGGTQRITSTGGDPDISSAINPIGGKPPCEGLPAAQAGGTAVASRRVGKPFTLLGLPTVRAQIRTKGRGGMIAARLWDVHDGKQLLVSRGIYRLKDNQKGKLVFQLFGNGWRFARGHTAKLELTGSDSSYVRTSNFAFSVKVSKLSVSLPTPGPGR